MKHTRAESAVELPCRQNDPELWFSEEPADVAAAKALCRSCPLRSECLDGALARREPYGVWGGELFLAGAIRERPVRRDKLDRTCAQCGGHISPKLRADAETCSRPCRERRARERIAERRAAGEAA